MGSRPTRPDTVKLPTPDRLITSKREELPDAFLRRCFFHYIRFPDREINTQIVDVLSPICAPLLREALTVFDDILEVPGLKISRRHELLDGGSS